jgi:hypothetical protein
MIATGLVREQRADVDPEPAPYFVTADYQAGAVRLACTRVGRVLNSELAL